MALSRALYLGTLLLCVCFYLCCGEWFSWVLLLAVAGFPWLSLLLSLRAMTDFSLSPEGPETLLMNTPSELLLSGRCRLPTPPFRGELRLHNRSTGQHKRYNAAHGVPTAHCGSYTVTVEKAKVYDYLGIFSLPVGQKQAISLQILPKPLPVASIPPLPHSQNPDPYQPGNGMSDSFELRPYRPGDRLNRLHWKLSAKTGSLIVRQVTQPQREPVLLTMILGGSPPERDRKLGRFFWLGNHILQQNLCFDLQVLTGTGIQEFSIGSLSDLNTTLSVLLSAPVASEEDSPAFSTGGWHYHIGGAPDDQT